MAYGTSIRRAENAEHEGLTGLMKRAMRHGGRAVYGPGLMEAWTAEDNKIFKFTLARHLFVAERERKIVAFGGWRPELEIRTAARLASIFVEPGLEGQGIGGKILAVLLADMRAAGFELARLYAMLNARPFYLAHGFEDAEYTEIPVAEGLKAEVVIMRKLL